MSNVELLKQITEAMTMVQGMTDFLGKDDVEKHLRWAAKNYAERIFNKSGLEN